MKKCILCLAIFLVILLPVSGQQRDSRIGIGTAIFLNILPGFGLGSFMQGDRVGGNILLAADLVGGGLYYGGMMWVMLLASGATPWTEPGSTLSAIITLTGGALFIGSKVYGISRPIGYAFDRLAQQESHEVSFSVTPSIRPSTGYGGVTMGVELVVRYELE